MPLRLWLLFACTIAMRALGCALHEMPGRDGVAYLWMAQQWARGDFGELFAHVFHPLYPFATGLVLMLRPTGDPVAAGQLVASGCSALAVLPLWCVARRLFGDGAAVAACLMFAIGAWFVRHPAECMSEGPFQLCAALWAAALLRATPRPALAGLAAGGAFLARPEGGALALAGLLFLWRRTGPRTALAHGAAAAAIGALLPLLAWSTGQGLVVTPKLAFNWHVGVGGADSGLAHYLHHLVRLPGDAWEGLGYAVFPLLALGIAQRRGTLTAAEWALLLPFLLQCAVIPMLRSNLRFVSGLGVLLLPFAGLACATLARRGRLWPWALVLLLAASEAKLWLGNPADRTIERELGRWLATQLTGPDAVASDMPRVWFFAGRRPPPPQEITAEDLRRWAADPACRFVALRRGRSDAVLPQLAAVGFLERPLPETLRAMPSATAVLLLERPPR